MPNFIFRLPLDNQLTDSQRIALDYDKSLVVTGGPGSGKTVVTINRFLSCIRNNKKAILFTYNITLLTSIKGLLRAKSEEVFVDLKEYEIHDIIENSIRSFAKFFKGIHYADEANVKTRFQNIILKERLGYKLNEIFFDEAQDLTPAVFANAFELAEVVTCGADNAQNLQGNFPPDEAVEIIFESLRIQKETYLQPLEANFRNTKEIFEFARCFVPDDESVHSIDTSMLNNGEIPEIIDGLTDENQLAKINEIIEAFPKSNIGILANFTWQIDQIRRFLEAKGYSCKEDAKEEKSYSYYYNGMDWNNRQVLLERMRTPFIATYDSCKGLEFDIVIMPFFNKSEEVLASQRQKELNADGTPKMWATRNHYYVGVTRARVALFVLCNGKPEILKDHYSLLSKYNNPISDAENINLNFESTTLEIDNDYDGLPF